MNANTLTINAIFNGNRQLQIPYFQRSYVWDIPQWERLLDDMELVCSRQTPYFMGAVILKQEATPMGATVGDVRTVIDGQQRLTTLNIFLKVLGLMIGDAYLSSATPGTLFRLRTGELALAHGHTDITAFEQVMGLTQLDDLKSDNSRILQAYNFFKTRINPAKLNYNMILNQVQFIGIDVAVNEDEQEIFDTINSLGVTLTTAELLKNYFFNRDYSSYVQYWKQVFEADEDTKSFWDTIVTTGRFRRSFIDLFFYAYLQIKIHQNQPTGTVSTEDKLEFSRVETLFASYKKYIVKYGIDKQKMLVEIKDYAELFRKNFNPDVLQQELTPNAGMDRINALIFGFDNSTLIPYILFLLHEQKDPNVLQSLVEYIETYVMRRIAARANNKNYNQLFTDRCIANKYLTRKQFRDFIADQTSQNTVNRMPSDSEIEEAFAHQIYINKTAANILYFIESKTRNHQKQSTHLSGMDSYSLEHLMPKKWTNHWSHPATQAEVDKRNRLLLTIGNLTIITQALNTSIRDSAWIDKLNGKNGKYGLKRYGAGIEISEDVLRKTEWNESKIAARSRLLCIKFKKIYTV